MVYVALLLVGVQVQAEVHVANGRIDAVLQTDGAIYVIEFKVNQSAETAMQQIKDRNYAAAYAGQPKQVYLMAINFNTEPKTVDYLTTPLP